MIIDEALDGIDAVIVDWDGTVVDSQQANYHALNQALRPHGVYLDRTWYRDHAGLSIVDLLTEIIAVHGELPTTEIVATSRQRLLAGLDQLRPVPATIELLDHAQDRGLPCAVASGAIRPLVAGGISALHLAHLFAAVVTREDVHHGKPAPDLYLRAAALLNVTPQRCLAVDDADDGVTAARLAGMRVLTLRDQRLCSPNAAPTLKTAAERTSTPL